MKSTNIMSLNKRTLVFLSLNFIFFVSILSFSVLYGSAGDPFIYIMLLFIICTFPIMFLKKVNGMYSLLFIFMMLYFMFYGLYDTLSLLPVFKATSIQHINKSMFTGGEIAILLGGCLFTIGFVTSIKLFGAKLSNIIVSDWDQKNVFGMGIFFWCIGMFGLTVWQFVYADTRVNSNISMVSGLVFIILRMLQPLGSALIIYSYLRHKKFIYLAILIALISVEFIFGFLADSKELSIKSIVVLIIANYLLGGKLPKKWLLLAFIMISLTFSIFQAYRYEVLQLKNQTREEAYKNIGSNIERTMKSKMISRDGQFISSIKGFVGRINLKGNMELLINKAGKSVPYQNGYTIRLLGYAFIPRFILPNKPDSSVGQLFNREFQISADPDTYISATHMGELYWNYGWKGLIVGMFIIGLLMGILGSCLSLEKHQNITRFLLFTSTIYLLCLRFEGGIALQYTLWIRTVVIILILHFIFRKIKLRTRFIN